MLDYLKTQQAKVDNLYSPGSSEYNTLWDTMSRKDAAAGRMSQYGPRSVDLGARIAQIKADNTVRMTTGIGSLYKNALDQEASAPAGLMAQLERLFTNTPKT
jgi:recombinational DNA repair protein RecT